MPAKLAPKVFFHIILMESAKQMMGRDFCFSKNFELESKGDILEV